ncbi:MAG: DUF6788 family protein [bacterium]
MKKNGSPVNGNKKQYERRYEALKKRIHALGFILQGSITERRIPCGNPGCRCKTDPQKRHGPYYQLSWKEKGKTVSVYLNEDKIDECRAWIENNHELEKIIALMRNLSRHVARCEKIVRK